MGTPEDAAIEIENTIGGTYVEKWPDAETPMRIVHYTSNVNNYLGRLSHNWTPENMCDGLGSEIGTFINPAATFKIEVLKRRGSVNMVPYKAVKTAAGCWVSKASAGVPY